MPSFRILRRTLLLGTAAPLLVLGGAALAWAEGEPQDRITGYTTEAEIRPDGTVAVQETITYDFGDLPSPGISREIPLALEGGTFLRERRIDVEGVEVSSPSGADTTIDGLSEEGGDLVLLVGAEDDPATDVTGEQTYVLSYTVTGALTPFEGHDEFYWNFVGTEWDVPILDVSVEVTAPEITGIDCYLGEEDGRGLCGTAEHDGAVAAFGGQVLAPGEGLTAAVALPPGTVQADEPVYALRPGFVPSLLALASIAAAAVAVLGLTGYRISTRSVRRSFPPHLPEELSPALAGLVCSSAGITSQVLLAMIVDLEERGVLSSEPSAGSPPDWRFTLHTPPDDPDLSAAESAFLRCVLPEGGTVDLEGIAERIDHADAERIKAALKEEGGRLGLWDHRRLAVSLLLVAGGLGAALGSVLLGVEGSVLIAVSMTATAIAAAALLGLSSLSHYGRHVRALLAAVRRDTELGGPRSVAQRPAWSIAVGAVDDAVGGAPPLTPGEQDRERFRPRPYYHDPLYRDRWRSSLDERLAPAPSSSGGGIGGGGSVGGGGGGGGGGRR